MFGDTYKIRKALVTLAIEKSLLEVGKPVYDLVIATLKEKYGCYLPDCYEHPQYLGEILKGLYGDAHKTIIELINKELTEFSDYDGIASFLRIVCK